MSEKNWTDQPDLVLQGEKVCGFFLTDAGTQVDVRLYPDGSYTLTLGNLFGSQTIRCESAEPVFRAISAIYRNGNKRELQLPAGCELIEEGA